MQLTYKVYYTILVPCLKKDKEMIITAQNPVRALDIFHKNVQSHESKSTNGIVTRPKLGPADYTVILLAHRYQDSNKTWIEAGVDLPKTPNPDTAKAVAPEPLATTMEMPLNDERRPAKDADQMERA